MVYEHYRFSFAEYIKFIILGSFIFTILSFFFYKSLVVIGISQLFIPFFLIYENRKSRKQRMKKLADEFSETLFSVSTNMLAGYSIENAFVESGKDLERLYGEKSLMAKEIVRIREGLSVNIPIEDLIDNLADRSHVDDICIFAEVFRSAKRNGGNLKDVLCDTAFTIREKMKIEREIQVIISEKQFELRIMEIVPFIILVYISVTSPGYFDPLYHNVKGYLFMTACLATYIATLFLGKKIVDVSI